MANLLMRWITVHPQEQKAELSEEKRRKREAARRVQKEEETQRCSRVTAERGRAAWCGDSHQLTPPSFAALHDDTNLRMISDMHGFLETAVWTTCMLCWRAWYAVDEGYQFAKPHVHNVSPQHRKAWFAVGKSKILRQWLLSPGDLWRGKSAEQRASSYPSVRDDLIECRCGAVGEKAGLADVCAACGANAWIRQVCECSECQDPPRNDKSDPMLLRQMAVDPVTEVRVEDRHGAPRWRAKEFGRSKDSEAREEDRGVAVDCIGRTLAMIAEPLHLMTDFEEMILCLVHPLVQVYTIPKTGELAYVGHVCNFRQDVSGFMSSLPVPPKNMPFIMVRPRTPPGGTNSKPRCPFPVNVTRLRDAFQWLREHNKWYQDIEWLRP